MTMAQKLMSWAERIVVYTANMQSVPAQKALKIGEEETYVSVCQNNKVIPFHVKEGQDEEAPSIFQDELPPLLKPVLVYRPAGVDEIQQHIVEEGLEGRDASPFERE